MESDDELVAERMGSEVYLVLEESWVSVDLVGSLAFAVVPEESLVVDLGRVSIFHQLEMTDEILETCLGNHVEDHCSLLVTLGASDLVDHVDQLGCREEFDLVVVGVA